MPKRTFDKISKKRSEECFTTDGSTCAPRKLIVYLCKMEITQLNRWRPMLRHDETPKLYFEGYVLRDSGKKRRYVTCKTEPLDIRLSCSLFKLRNGDMYSLVGELYDPDNSIPPLVKTKFRNGIPKKLQSVIKSWNNIKNYSPCRKPLRSFTSSCSWLESLKESGQVKVSSRGRIIIPSPKLLKGEKLSPQLIKKVQLITKHLKFFRRNLGPMFNKTTEEQKPLSTEDIKPEFDAVTGTVSSPHSEHSDSVRKTSLNNNSVIEVNKCRKVFCVQNNRNLIKERSVSNINQRIIGAFKHQKVPVGINNNVCRNEKNTKTAYEKVTKQKYSKYNANKPKYQLRSSSGTRLSPKKCPCCEIEDKVSVNNVTKVGNEHIKGESTSYNECEVVMTAVPKTEQCSDLLTHVNVSSMKKQKECKDVQKRQLEKSHLSLKSIKPETNLNNYTATVQKTNLQMLNKSSQNIMLPSSSGAKTTNKEAWNKLPQKMKEKKSETFQKFDNKPGPDISNNNSLTCTPSSCSKRSEKKNACPRRSAREKTLLRTIVSCSYNTDIENDRVSGKSMPPGPTEELCVKLSASERQAEDRKSTVPDSRSDKKDSKGADKSRSEKKNAGLRRSAREKTPLRTVVICSYNTDIENDKSSGKSMCPGPTEELCVKLSAAERQTEDRKSTITNSQIDKKESKGADKSRSEKKNSGLRRSAREKTPLRTIIKCSYNTDIENDRFSGKSMSPGPTEELCVKLSALERQAKDRKSTVSDSQSDKKDCKGADKSRSEKKNVRCEGTTQVKKPPRKINTASCNAEARNEEVIGKSISPLHVKDTDGHVKLKPSEKQLEDRKSKMEYRKSAVADKLGDKKDASVANTAGSEKKHVGGKVAALENKPSRKTNNGSSSTKVRNDRSSEKYLSPVHNDKKDTRIKQSPCERETEDKKNAVSNKLNSSKEDNVADRSGNKSAESSKSKCVTKLSLTKRDVKGNVRGQVFASRKKTNKESDSDSGEENIDSSLLSEENVRKLERQTEESKPRLSLNEIDDLLDTGAPRTLKKRKQLKKIMDSYSNQKPSRDLFTDPDYNHLIENSSYSSQEWDLDYDVAVEKIFSGNSYDQLSLGSTPPAVYVPEFVNDDNISVRSKSPFERAPCDENDTLRYVHRVLKEKNVQTKRKSHSKAFVTVSPTKEDALVEANDAYSAFVEGKPMPAKLFDLKHRKKNSSSDECSSDTSED